MPPVQKSPSGKKRPSGYAKNKMVNAVLAAHRIISMLPPVQRPEHTEGYEGFFHVMHLKGNVEEAEIRLIIRDHDFDKFEEMKKWMREIVSFVNREYGYEVATLEMSDQYYNMRRKIEPVMHIVELAKEAMRKAGIPPKISAIRGGTDGARLSYEGLPCPNIFAGGHNFHGPYEYIPIPSMQKAVEVILNIAELAVPEEILSKINSSAAKSSGEFLMKACTHLMRYPQPLQHSPDN